MKTILNPVGTKRRKARNGAAVRPRRGEPANGRRSAAAQGDAGGENLASPKRVAKSTHNGVSTAPVVEMVTQNGVVEADVSVSKRKPRVGDLDPTGRRWNGKHWVFHRGMSTLWKPGQSGNPNGRPKRRTFGEDAYDLLMHELDDIDKEKLASLLRCDVTELERVDHQRFIAAVWVRRAMKGDAEAFREIFDRRDPKPRRIEVSGRGGAPLAAAIAAGRMTEKDAVDVYRALVEGGDDDEVASVV